MKYLLSIDPGMESGIILGHYDDDTPYERDAFWQVDGGIDGFKAWRASRYSSKSDYWYFPEALSARSPVIVCEKFVPLATDRAFRIDELEPIRIEGALEAWGHEVIWQRAGCQVLAGGEDAPARKKATNELLKRGGLWLTGKKNLGLKDANDANSAQKHALYYMMFTKKHLPTLERYGSL